MSDRAQTILEQLKVVAAERARRLVDPELAVCVAAIKEFQQRRFARTYVDLLASSRYGAASRFFLDELYGPKDFSQRDAQFARVVPAMVRLFPSELVDTVADLAFLHALTEQLVSRVGGAVAGRSVEAQSYALAWRTVGGAELRDRQISLTVAVGSALDRLTRKPLLRQSLHLMRGPARAAGLGALQAFLESGFDTFKAMKGADEFLRTVEARERSLARSLFANPTEAELLALLP